MPDFSLSRSLCILLDWKQLEHIFPRSSRLLNIIAHCTKRVIAD